MAKNDILEVNNLELEIIEKIKESINNNVSKKNNNLPKINFIVGSVSFFQLYTPLIKKYREHNYEVRLILRSNKTKQYSDPISNRKLYQEIIKKYKLIEIFNKYEWIKEGGITYCVDGDIYWEKEINYNESYLVKHFINLDSNIRSKHTIISLVENTNFVWVYNKYIDLVDFVIFNHKYYMFGYYYYRINNFIPFDENERNILKNGHVAGYLCNHMMSDKNLFMGNLKFDFIEYQRHGLPEKDDNGNLIKYAVLFHPEYRFPIGQKYYGEETFNNFYKNMLKWIRELGYKIIIKDRHKNVKGEYDKEYRNPDDTYISMMGIFPNPSLELIALSDLAIFFSSSVIEEVVYYKIPFIEVAIDSIYRLDFYRDDKYGYLIKDNLPSEEEFKDKVNQMELQKRNGLIDEYVNDKHLFYFPDDKYRENSVSDNIFNSFH